MFDIICNTGRFEETSKVSIICRSSLLYSMTPQIVFFITDEFADKLTRAPLENYFPDYSGQSYDSACDYFLNRFVSVNRSESKVQIYAHFTNQIDTQQVRCESLIPRLHTTGDNTKFSHA